MCRCVKGSVEWICSLIWGGIVRINTDNKNAGGVRGLGAGKSVTAAAAAAEAAAASTTATAAAAAAAAAPVVVQARSTRSATTCQQQQLFRCCGAAAASAAVAAGAAAFAVPRASCEVTFVINSITHAGNNVTYVYKNTILYVHLI